MSRCPRLALLLLLLLLVPLASTGGAAQRLARRQASSRPLDDWRLFGASLQAEPNSGPLAPQSEEAETFYIRKGANGTLPCLPVKRSDSQAAMNKIEWFKEDKKLVEAEAKHIVVWNTKSTVAYLPDSGALLFRGVGNEDSGEYHCLLTRQATGDTEDGIVRFYVQDVPGAPQMPIVVAVAQRSINLSWVPSHDFHHSPILHYVIHLREGLAGQWDVANGQRTPDNRTQFEILGLKPFTTYSFRVLAVNNIGVGEPSPASHPIVTMRQKPDSRLKITSARNVSSTSIRLEWLRPSQEEIHGEFLGYRIRYVAQLHEHAPAADSAPPAAAAAGQQVGGARWPPPVAPVQQPSLDGPLAKQVTVGDPEQTFYVVKGLSTFTPYRFSVQVSNMAGDGPEAEVLAMTDEGVPSQPLSVSLVRVLDTSVKLRWLQPQFHNGVLQGYQILLHDFINNLNDSRKLSDPQSVMEHTIGELSPFTWYIVHVQAYSRKFLGELSQPLKFRTDVSAPSQPQLLNLTCSEAPADAIRLQWRRPDTFHSTVDFYYVQYKADGDWKFEEIALVARKEKLLNELSITNLTGDLAYELRVIAATRSLINGTHVYRSEPSPTVRVLLEPNCQSYTAYPVTESTFNASLVIGVFCASFALALVCASLVVWRRHCQAAYYYLDDPQPGSRATNSPQLSETYDDSEYGSVPVNDWAKHVQKLHADGDIGFSKEFEAIQKSNQANLSYSCSQLPENKHKNRYINIVAYDHTRVSLRPLPGHKKPGYDYINANFIDGYNKPRAYIGTQGPLVSTFDDYWRMIWEQRVVIIVMITNLQERGRRKCDMYWPKEGTETYGHIQVKLLQEVVMATYTLRTFTARNLKLKKRGFSERTVYQYHYTNWPDHGVPDHPLPVLSFVRKSASANPAGAGAIICHCSAGCGRSGTYIVIDAMLKQIRHRQSINVVDFLKHIRSQRNYLVQTEEQYIFIHDSLLEAIESGETEIASSFIPKYMQLLQNGCFAQQQQQQQQLCHTGNGFHGGKAAETAASGENLSSLMNSQSNLLLSNGNLNGPINVQNSGSKSALHLRSQAAVSPAGNQQQQQQQQQQWSLLERQYRLVASFKAKDFNVVSALKPCNKTKNRTLNLIPLEAHRVHITQKPGSEGSDYINATFLMGFNHLREFIVTQHPVYETFSDFWQMVYDHNSQIIVLLTPMKDLKEFGQFWPQKEDEVDYGSFKVKLTQETTLLRPENGALIVSRDFMMRSNQDDYELQTRIIHCPGWPECCGPLTGVFDLIQLVQSATQQLASQQRLHDGNQASITVTIGQEHEPQNGGPIIVVDKFGGTEAATFAVLTTLYKQINFEDAVDVYMYAKLAHLRRPGIWTSQDDYLFLYRAIENYAASLRAQQSQPGEPASPAGAGALAPAGFPQHHTMTLDRHKRRSSAMAALKSSTMRRGQPALASPLREQLAADFRKSTNQLLLMDCQSPQTRVPQPQPQPQPLVSDQQLQNGIAQLVKRPVQQQAPPSMQAALKEPQSAGSQPTVYNSAIKFANQGHQQHLLAGSNSACLPAPAPLQVQQVGAGQQQLQAAGNKDRYLYPMG